MSRENDLTIEVYEKYGQKYLDWSVADLKSGSRTQTNGKLYAGLFEKYTRGLPPDAAIFEVGSASGRDAKTLKRLGFKNITVSDVTDFFINHLASEGFAPIKFNLITDEFPSKYDMIVCWSVVVHFTKSEAVAAIRKIYEALKPRGRLALSVKHKDGHDEEWNDRQGKIGAKRYFTYWSKADIERVLRDIGFAEVSIERHGGTRSCWLNCYAEK